MLKKYIKADKKSFRLHDQNLKLRKASFRIFHSKRNVSFFSSSAIQCIHYSGFKIEFKQHGQSNSLEDQCVLANTMFFR